MNKFKDKVSILGTEYRIVVTNEEETPAMADASGLTDDTVHTIFLDDCSTYRDDCGKKDLDQYMRRVLRHEIVHAFLYESGLAVSSMEATEWAINEEMVDWFARQSPKIFRAFKEAGCDE